MGTRTDSDQPGVRLLTPADAEAWWTLRLRALRDFPGAFITSYEEAAASPLAEALAETRVQLGEAERVVHGAFADGALIGVVGCRRETRAKLRHKAFVWGVYVAPEARGRGIARDLMAATISHARTWPGVVLLTLGVATDNTPAVALYRRLGFRVYGTEPRAFRDGDRYVDEYLMQLDLDAP